MRCDTGAAIAKNIFLSNTFLIRSAEFCSDVESFSILSADHDKYLNFIVKRVQIILFCSDNYPPTFKPKSILNSSGEIS